MRWLIYYGYTLEAPEQCAANEYPSHMFRTRNKKNINIVEKKVP